MELRVEEISKTHAPWYSFCGKLVEHYEIDTSRQWHISPIDGRIFYGDEQVIQPEPDP